MKKGESWDGCRFIRVCCDYGVCLKTARATDSGRKATIGGCGTAFVIGVGQVARGFREREA